MAGYVAGFPIPEVLQGINAFTLGMRSVDPKAQVKVVWLNAWFDPPRERDAAMSAVQPGRGRDRLPHRAPTPSWRRRRSAARWPWPTTPTCARPAPDAQIAGRHAPVGRLLHARARQAVLDGSWKSGNVWGGVKEGMIRVGDFGPKVPKAVQDEVLARQKDIAAGKLQPFAGPIVDNEGKLVRPPRARP